MPTYDYWSLLHVGVIAVLSTIVPIGIFLGRNNVRLVRKDIVVDLEQLFKFASKDGRPLILPSFELVKYKYDPGSNPDRSAKDSSQAQSLRYYAFLILIYVFISVCGFLVAFSPLPPSAGSGSPTTFTNTFIANPNGLFGGSITYTFIGAYVWSIIYLIRRVSNYNLSPLSFYQCCIHILFAAVVSGVVWHSHIFDYWTNQPQAAQGPKDRSFGDYMGNLRIVIAMVIGFFPDLFINAIVARFPMITLRRIRTSSKLLQEELPLDMILGIDPMMKLRLAEFEIEDVQNLATINPLQIFVETPYGLYQVIDWVAQAQLILAVGPDRIAALRTLAIRTIFDLERCVENRELRGRLEQALVGPVQVPRSSDDQPLPAYGEGDPRNHEVRLVKSDIHLHGSQALDAIIEIIRDDLHVRRMRQIWDIINVRLNERPAADT